MSTPRTLEVHLPASEDPHEILAAYHSLMMALGLELGGRYDRHCRPTHGIDWLDKLMSERGSKHGKKPVHLYDPSFVLNEPLRNPSSPTRECLPHGKAFYNLLEDLVDVRNSWAHFIVPIDLKSLREAATLVHTLATKAEMQLGAAVSALIKRVKGLIDGTWTPDPATPAEVATISTNTVPHEISDQIALDQREIVERDVRESQALAVPPARPPVGGVWADALPERTARLTKLGDLVDTETGASLRGLLGDRAAGRLNTWSSLRPMGDLRIAGDGAVVAFLSGTARLIGYLGTEPDADLVAIRGFALPYLYRVTNSDVLDGHTGARLSKVDGVGAAAVLAAIIDEVPPGGTIRVTNYGDVVHLDTDGMTKVAQVAPEEWFPGQLT